MACLSDVKQPRAWLHGRVNIGIAGLGFYFDAIMLSCFLDVNMMLWLISEFGGTCGSGNMSRILSQERAFPKIQTFIDFSV